MRQGIGRITNQGTAMELSEPVKALLIEAALALRGRARRAFMARIVIALGRGGQRRAERELGWCRVTIRKGMRELECAQNSGGRGGGPGTVHTGKQLPHLLADIRAVVERHHRDCAQCPEDASVVGLSAGEVRRRLITQQGYSDAELPTVQTIAARLKALGYVTRRASRSGLAVDPEAEIKHES